MTDADLLKLDTIQASQDILEPEPQLTPLTDGQESLCILSRLCNGLPLYNIPIAIRLRGPLNLSALEHSLSSLAARQDLLRATLPAVAGRPRLVIAAPGPVAPRVEEASGLPEAAHAARIAAFVAAAGQQVFDLAAGPLWQTRLLRLGPLDHVLTLAAHRAVLDDGSMPVLLQELAAHYAGARAGQPPDLPPLPLQYAGYAAQQRATGQGRAMAKHVAYWQQQLAGAPAVLGRSIPENSCGPAI